MDDLIIRAIYPGGRLAIVFHYLAYTQEWWVCFDHEKYQPATHGGSETIEEALEKFIKHRIEEHVND